MLDGVLYRVSKDVLVGKKRWQYVVPDSLVRQVLQGIHMKLGIKVRVGLYPLRDRSSSG